MIQNGHGFSESRPSGHRLDGSLNAPTAPLGTFLTLHLNFTHFNLRFHITPSPPFTTAKRRRRTLDLIG